MLRIRLTCLCSAEPTSYGGNSRIWAGERLLFITGGIDAGPEGGETVKGARRACEEHNLPNELLDAATLHRRFPGYCLPNDMVAIYQPDGGFVLPERCIVNHVLAAQSVGADVHAREKVLGWEPRKGGVHVRTDHTSYSAGKLVITAGPWARTLVPALGRLAVPERQVLLWAQPLRPELFRLGAFPIFNMEAIGTGKGLERFYGFPVYGIPGFKIGKYHHLGGEADQDHVDRDIHPEDEYVLRQGIRRFFPDADGPTMALKTCLFTNSPDEHFILDLHPDVPEVSIAAGFSGHGFKFCSVVGEIMTDLALGCPTKRWDDLRLFRLARFNTPLS